MASLSNLTDEQNMLLTQLAYASDVLGDNPVGMTFRELYETVTDPKAKNTLKKLCDQGMGDFRVKDVGNDPVTGFGAIAFTDGNGNTGFSYRGTDGIQFESINDWIDNVEAMASGTSAQTLQAEAFFDRNRDPGGNNYLYGHSKGGNLAESVYANNYRDIQGVHLLNPQPLNPHSLTADQKLAMKSDKVDIVIIEGDYVWWLGKLPSYGNIRIAKGDGTDPHQYAAIENMFDEDGNIIESKQPWWEYVGYFVITGLIGGVQYAYGKIGFVYSCVVRIYDFLKNDLLPEVQKFIAEVINAVKKFANEVKEFVTELQNFFADTVDRIASWLKKKLGIQSADDYVKENPYINADPQTMREYAYRLDDVNRRLLRLDGDLNDLYLQVRLRDLDNILKANIVTSYSVYVKRSSTFLKKAAEKLENAENRIYNALLN